MKNDQKSSKIKRDQKPDSYKLQKKRLSYGVKQKQSGEILKIRLNMTDLQGNFKSNKNLSETCLLCGSMDTTEHVLECKKDEERTEMMDPYYHKADMFHLSFYCF